MEINLNFLLGHTTVGHILYFKNSNWYLSISNIFRLGLFGLRRLQSVVPQVWYPPIVLLVGLVSQSA